MTLRAKLLLAQAPTALVLVIVGVISVSAMAALGRGPGLILKDNYRSVLAAERMLEAIGTLQAVALSRATGRERDDGRAAAARTTFEEELRTQEANITEIGEREATRRLRGRWTEYQAGLDGELAGERHRLAHYFDVLEPAYRRVQAAAGEILGLNQDAMQRKSERARRSSEQATTLVLATTVAALAIGIALSLALTARLLRPLAALAQTVRRIGEGDLEARAPARGRDEIAGLASEFNTMAERLLQYRQSSLG